MTELPPDWTIVTLEQLAAGPDAMTDGPFGSNLKTSHYTDAGPRVVRLQNIGFGEFIDEQSHISHEHFDRLRKHGVEPGDLVVASLGSELLRACVAPTHLGPAIVKADCIRVRIRPDVDPQYVNLALQRPELRRAVTAQIHGVGRPRIGMSGVRRLTIPLAPPEERERILETTQDLLSRLQQASAELSSARRRLLVLRQSLFAQANDARWPIVSVGEVLVDIETGRSVRTSGQRAAPDRWGVVKVSAMTSGEFKENENKELPAGLEVDPHHEIKPGDLLLSRANTSDYVGASVLVGQTRPKLVLSDKSMRLVTRPNVNKRWLHLALSSPQVRSHMSRVATGTSDSMRNISQDKVRALQVHLPPIDEQSRLVARITDALGIHDRLLDEIQGSIQRGSLMRSSILAAAFTGRLTSMEASLV